MAINLSLYSMIKPHLGMKNLMTILLAAIVGEIALAVLTTIAQEVLFGGIDYYISSNFDLVFGGMATFPSRRFGRMHRLPDCQKSKFLATLDHIIFDYRRDGLLDWYGKDFQVPFGSVLRSGLSLIIGVWAGYYFMVRRWGTRVDATL